MFRTSRGFILLISVLLPWSGAATIGLDDAQESNPRTATLVVFNDSGPTMVPFKLSLRENGCTIVNLSRHEYQRVSIPEGRHVYNVPPRHQPSVVLEAEAGQTYYLIIAYRPERQLVPFASPYVLKQISEQEAGMLVARMTERTAATPESPDEGKGSDAPVATMHAPRAPNQSPNVSITLQEWSRTPGRKGTVVIYRIRTAGFPPENTFTLRHAAVDVQWQRTTLSTGIRSNASGVLTGGSVPIEELRLSIHDYYKAEAMLVEVVGDDGSVYAVDKVYPFPLAARDQTCVVWAELANEDRREFVMFGNGFEPGEQVTVRSTDGYDPKQWTESVNDSGGFAVSVLHRKSGGAGVFSAAGKHCAPTLPYEYGKKAVRQ